MASRNQIEIEVLTDVKQAVNGLQKIQKGTDQLSDEAQENFMKMRKSMDEMNEKTTQTSTAMAGMTQQFSYALSDLPMIFTDVRMGLMGIMNNIQPMMNQFGQAQRQAGGFGKVMKQLGSTLVGPAGFSAAVMAAVSLGPKLIDMFTDSEKAAEDANEAHKELISSLKSIREITDPDSIDKKIEKRKEELEVQKGIKNEYQSRQENLQNLIQAYNQVAQESEDRRASEVLSASMMGNQRDIQQETAEEERRRKELKDKIQNILVSINTKYKTQEELNKVIKGDTADLKVFNEDINDTKGEIKKKELEILALKKQRKRLTQDEKKNMQEMGETEVPLQVDTPDRILPELAQPSEDLLDKLREANKYATEIGAEPLEFFKPPDDSPLLKETEEFKQKLKEANEYAKEMEDYDPPYWNQLPEYGLVDRIKQIKRENTALYNSFQLIGNTASQALLQADNAGQALLNTLKSIGVKLASQTILWAGLQMFGGPAAQGLSLGKFITQSLFGGTFAEGGDYPANKISFVGEKGIEAIMPGQSGKVISNDRLVSVMRQAMNPQQNVTVRLDGEKIPVETKVQGRDLWLVNEKAKKDKIG